LQIGGLAGGEPLQISRQVSDCPPFPLSACLNEGQNSANPIMSFGLLSRKNLMKARLVFAIYIGCAARVLSQEASTPAPELFLVDAQTPQGLRELFKPTAARLPLLSAHRGGAGPGFPENCMATLEATVRHGWSMLEIDLRTTKDGTIVLMHDPTLDRTTNGRGPVKDHTLKELRELRLKDRQGNLTNHRIPTLDEAMKWARGKALLALDKKDVPVKEVVRVIMEHRAEAYALLMAYNINEVMECHALNRDIMMEVMMGTRERFDEFDRSGVPWSNVIAFVGHTQTPDADHCQRIRAKGASCMAGTSRNIDRQFLSGSVTSMDPLRPEYRAVLDRGVDVIETDIPRELGRLLFADRPPTAAKAQFFRIGVK
jgi:glycerophosphoryl diester phosphodiesterase